jgi:sortase (surface protein transpeptidase)
MMTIPSAKKLFILGGMAVVFGISGVAVALIGLTPPTSAEETVITQQEVLPELPQPATSNIVTTPVSGRPTRITIPSLGVDLAVINGYYHQQDGTWTLSKTKAQFATPSQLANNTSGTTFIYGHDTKAVFRALHSITKDAVAIVTTDNGYRFVYTFSDSVITSPLSIGEVTAASATPRLSLQTCYGATSADRQIFHLYLQRVEKL